MKAFEMPRMEVVHLMKEDIVRTSICNGFSCQSYRCDPCVECDEEVYVCFAFICHDAHDRQD